LSDVEPQSLEAAPHAPPSPDYMSGPKHPPSPDYPYHRATLLTQTLRRIQRRIQRMTLRRILLTILPTKDMRRRGNGSSWDDADDEDEEETFKEEDDNEEEHLASADSSTVPIDDLVPSAEETKPFQTDDHRRRDGNSSVGGSSLTPLSFPLPQIPSPPLPLPSPPLPLPAPSSPLLLPATDRREDVPEANVPPRKRLCLTDPTPRFEVRESSSAAAARQLRLDVTHATDYGFVNNVDATLGRPMTRKVGYGITDVWDDIVGDMEETAPGTLEAVNQRVADLATTLAQDSHETYLLSKEAMYGHGAWASFKDRSAAIEAHTLETKEPARTNDPEDADGSA
nr:hypothetical protein [Tanacetum cinerariifolium]